MPWTIRIPRSKSDARLALGEIGDKRAAARAFPITDRAGSRVEELRRRKSLGRIGDARAVPYLIEMTHDDGRVCCPESVWERFRKLKSPQSIEPLTQLCWNTNRVEFASDPSMYWVRWGTRWSRSSSSRCLRNDRSEDVRAAAAAKALGEIRDPGSVDSSDRRVTWCVYGPLSRDCRVGGDRRRVCFGPVARDVERAGSRDSLPCDASTWPR